MHKLEKQTRKVKLLVSRLFFSFYLNRGSMTKHFTAESRPGISLLTSISFIITGRRTCTNSSVGSGPNTKGRRKVKVLERWSLNSRTLPPFHSVTMCDLATKFSGKLVIFSVPSILIRGFLINTLFFFCTIFSDLLWLRFGAKKLSNVRTRFWCDILLRFLQACKFWSSKAN